MRLRTQPWHGWAIRRAGTAGLFLAFLGTVFAIELVIMGVLPWFTRPDEHRFTLAVIDGAVLAGFVAPVVWLAFIRPLQRLHESRGYLLGRLLSAEEDERRRIAAELHDGLGQNLTTMLLRLKVIEDMAISDIARDNAAALREITALSLAEVRDLVRNTRPPVLDARGLAAAIEKQLVEVADASGIRTDFSWPGGEGRRFAPEIELAAYRIIQEAITNAVRHGRPERITIEVGTPNSDLTATIRDDGCGFDVRRAVQPEQRPFGLLGMRERVAPLGGTVDVTSRSGEGTTVRLRIPLPPGSER